MDQQISAKGAPTDLGSTAFDWLWSLGAGRALSQLRKSGQLALLLPEVNALYGVEQNPEHHPEICTGIHIEMCLSMAEQLQASRAAKFAVLLHDLGKALTPKGELPRHIAHESRGIAPVRAVCARLGASDYLEQLSVVMCEHHLNVHRSLEHRSSSVLSLIAETGMERDDIFAEDLLIACEADKRGRLGKEGRPYDQGQFLRRVLEGLKRTPPLVKADTRQWHERHSERLGVVRSCRAAFKDA